jgi:hypothetical protein
MASDPSNSLSGLVITPSLRSLIASYRSFTSFLAKKIVDRVVFDLFFTPAGRLRRRGCGAYRNNIVGNLGGAPPEFISSLFSGSK